MPSVKDLGKRLKSVTSTSKITKAMKMVAASKLRQAEASMNAARPFALSVQNLMLPHIGMKGDEKSESVMTLAISSDKGLCGGINGKVVKESKASLAALEAQGGSPQVHAAAQHASRNTRALQQRGVPCMGGFVRKGAHPSRAHPSQPSPPPPPGTASAPASSSPSHAQPVLRHQGGMGCRSTALHTTASSSCYPGILTFPNPVQMLVIGSKARDILVRTHSKYLKKTYDEAYKGPVTFSLASFLAEEMLATSADS
jgi:hypothetical protein